MTKEELNKPATTVQECIIEIPLVEIFVDGKSIGFHNEYTVRRIVLAVHRKQIPNNIKFFLENKEHFIKQKEDHTYVNPVFPFGFYDLSYTLSLALMD